MGLKKKKNEPQKPEIRWITRAKRHMEWQDIPRPMADTLLSTSIQFPGGGKEWGVMKQARSRGTWEGKKFQRVGRGEKKTPNPENDSVSTDVEDREDANHHFISISQTHPEETKMKKQRVGRT